MKLYFLVLVGLLTCFLLGSLGSVKAAAGDVVWTVTPSLVTRYTNTTNIGDRFNVTIIHTDISTYALLAVIQVHVNYNHTILNCTNMWGDVNNSFILYGHEWAYFAQVAPDGGNESNSGGAVGDHSGSPYYVIQFEFEIMSTPDPGETISSLLNITYIDESFNYGCLCYDDALEVGFQPNTVNGNFTYVSSGEAPPPPPATWQNTLDPAIITLVQVLLPTLYLVGVGVYFIRENKKPSLNDIVILAVCFLFVVLVFPAAMSLLF